jgi:hypothetical protein
MGRIGISNFRICRDPVRHCSVGPGRGQGAGFGIGCGIGLGCMVAQHPIDEAHQTQGIARRERQVGRLAPEAGGLERLQVREAQGGEGYHRRLREAPGRERLPHVLVDRDRGLRGAAAPIRAGRRSSARRPARRQPSASREAIPRTAAGTGSRSRGRRIKQANGIPVSASSLLESWGLRCRCVMSGGLALKMEVGFR